MSRVITFSIKFPAYHIRKGNYTLFVERIWKGLLLEDKNIFISAYVKNFKPDLPSFSTLLPKYTTIRAGNRWKAGQIFSPRVWSATPRRSKQITIAPDIEIKNVWPIEIYGLTVLINNVPVNNLTLSEVAQNDGLTLGDFNSWFNKVPFVGQIISWNENIQY